MPLTSPRTGTFKDIPFSFVAHPVTGKVGVAKDDDAVKQAVKTLVLSNFYERPYSPLKGGNIIGQLFENMAPITSHNVSKNIRQVLDNYEPRVEVQDIKINAVPDSNGINVTITFFILNQPELVEVTIFLERVR